MAITKPDWLRSYLESEWLNIYRGAWWDNPLIPIPPFSFTPGLWIEAAIDWAITFIDTALSWGKTAWAWAEDAWNKATEALGKIGGWLQYAASIITDTIVNWWRGVLPTLQDWFWNTYDSLFKKASDAWDWILNANKWVREQLDEYLPDWFLPFRSLLGFWDNFGKKAVDFFNDPGGWFEAAFTWFLGIASWPFLRAIEAFLNRIWDEEE